MQFNKIYLNGCSFMWGMNHSNPTTFPYFEETKDIDTSHGTHYNGHTQFNNYDWVRQKYNIAGRLKEHYTDIDIIDQSIYGGSLKRVVRKTYNWIINNYESAKDTLFILEWPVGVRNEMYVPMQNRYVNYTSNFDNFEPRFSVTYELNSNQSIKASYNRMVQYLQLVSNTSSPTPLDVWTPSDNYIKPQIADQVAFGYFKNFHEDTYSLEVETFYKTVKNRIDYIDGANLIANEALEQVILNGQLRSYGLELLLRKNTGKLNGWVSYTLSRSEQQTPGRNANEIGINNGNWYSSVYDKLHNLAVTGNYNWSDKWSFGANFIMQTGQPVTYPNGQYQIQGITCLLYTSPSPRDRQKSRMPSSA